MKGSAAEAEVLKDIIPVRKARPVTSCGVGADLKASPLPPAPSWLAAGCRLLAGSQSWLAAWLPAGCWLLAGTRIRIQSTRPGEGKNVCPGARGGVQYQQDTRLQTINNLLTATKLQDCRITSYKYQTASITDCQAHHLHLHVFPI